MFDGRECFSTPARSVPAEVFSKVDLRRNRVGPTSRIAGEVATHDPNPVQRTVGLGS